MDRAAGHADDRQAGLGPPVPAQVVGHAHGAGRVARHGVDAAVGRAGADGQDRRRLGRQPVQPLVGRHRLAGGRVVAEAAPVALGLDRLVRDRALDDEHERVEFAAVGLVPPLDEVVGARSPARTRSRSAASAPRPWAGRAGRRARSPRCWAGSPRSARRSPRRSRARRSSRGCGPRARRCPPAVAPSVCCVSGHGEATSSLLGRLDAGSAAWLWQRPAWMLGYDGPSAPGTRRRTAGLPTVSPWPAWRRALTSGRHMR